MKKNAVFLFPWRHGMALAPLLLVACQSVQTTQGGAVGVTRSQQMSSLVSGSELERGAAQAYQQILGKAQKEGKLNPDPAQVARVRGIVQRLIAQTTAFRPDAAGWRWEANVVGSPDVNAWVMPGGKIAVYTGLIDKLQPTDAELAAVIGHEIAHALREHARERASRQLGSSAVATVLGVVTGSQAVADMAGMASDLTFNLPNSRLHETEADQIGVELAARAGYDPRAAITLWQKMGRIAGANATPQFLSTHPSGETRIRDLEAISARVLPIYETGPKMR
jgi:predicted Zn-dependent protease